MVDSPARREPCEDCGVGGMCTTFTKWYPQYFELMRYRLSRAFVQFLFLPYICT